MYETEGTIKRKRKWNSETGIVRKNEGIRVKAITSYGAIQLFML